MATNLAIDDKLIEEAVKLSRHKTKRAAVTEALEEYVSRRKQLLVKEAFNSIEYDAKHDYKRQRKVK
jgi:Arc/MetJ family transcription regulator